MKQRLVRFLTLLVVATAMLSGIVACDSSTTNDDEAPPAYTRAWTDADVDAVVQVHEETLYKPLDIEGLPEECNYIHYQRVGLKNSDGIVANADSILVIQTGVIVGNNAFRFMSKQMVYMAKEQRNKRIEVIMMDRRYNCFEDTTGANEAEAKKDVQVAVDYYYNNAEINGKTFEGFKNNAEMDVLSKFGLKIVMEDIFHTMTTLVPSQADRQEKLFMLGHSLGGFFAMFFLGWDFDGNAETLDDAGYNNVAGVVMMDSLLSHMMDMFEPMIRLLPKAMQDMVPGVVGTAYPALVGSVEVGLFPRLLPFDVIGFSAETFLGLELLAMGADFAPDEQSTVLEDADYGIMLNLALRLIHSRDVTQFLDPFQPAYIRDFKYTNEAMFGVALDDNFMPVQLPQASMGFLTGGDIRKKNFPVGSNWPMDNPIGDVLEIFFTGDNLFIPDSGDTNKENLFTWKNFDEIGPTETSEDGSLQYTTDIEEVSDIHDVAKLFYEGSSNMMEWYFPTRLIVDMLEAPYRVRPDYGLYYMHEFDYVNSPPVPLFYRIAGSGPFVKAAMEYGFTMEGDVICEGYDHLDLFGAAPYLPDRRENEVFLPVIDYMIGVTGN